MTTFVGTQTNFADAIKALVELDHDAVESYEAAINRLENAEYKKQLQNFKEDHQRHVKELNDILVQHNEQPVTSPGLKQWLAKGKVVLANILGDDAILKAMLDNEKDTNKAYEKMNSHEKKWADADDVLKRGLADEKRHKKWIEESVDG